MMPSTLRCISRDSTRRCRFSSQSSESSSNVKSCSPATSSIPAMMLPKKLLFRYGTSTPIKLLRWVTSDRAATFGVYPILRAAS